MSWFYAWQVALLVLSLLLYTVFQFVIFRLSRAKSIVKSFLLAFLAGAGFLVSTEFLTHGAFAAIESSADFLALSVVNLIIYSCVSYCFFHFLNIGEASLRVRLLREMTARPAGMTLSEILDRYNARQIIEVRKCRLLESGQLIDRDGRYYPGRARLLYVGQAFQLLKFLFLRRKRS